MQRTNYDAFIKMVSVLHDREWSWLCCITVQPKVQIMWWWWTRSKRLTTIPNLKLEMSSSKLSRCYRSLRFKRFVVNVCSTIRKSLSCVLKNLSTGSVKKKSGRQHWEQRVNMFVSVTFNVTPNSVVKANWISRASNVIGSGVMVASLGPTPMQIHKPKSRYFSDPQALEHGTPLVEGDIRNNW